MRGFFAGGLWGVVVGGVAVAAASLVNPPPKLPQEAEADGSAPENAKEIDSTVTVETGDGPSIATPSDTAEAPISPEGETPVSADTAPTIADLPITDSVPAVDTAEPEQFSNSDSQNAQGAVPNDENDDVAETDVDADAPSSSKQAQVLARPDQSVDDNSSSVAPEIAADNLSAPAVPSEGYAPNTIASLETAPETAASPAPVTVVSTAPKSPANADTATVSAPEVAAASTLEEPAAISKNGSQVTETKDPVVPTSQPDAPAAPNEELPISSVEVSVDEPEVVVTAPVVSGSPVAESDAPDVKAVEDPTPLTPQSPVSPAEPEASDDLPTSEDGSGSLLAQTDSAPVVSVLPGRETGVRINRIGQRSDDTTDDVVETSPADEAIPEDAPAVLRFAAPSDNPDSLPELSVVLADDGSFDGAIAAIAGLPFPVSVMINPSVSGASDRMAAYRAAGIEVGMLVSLPPAATATDVAVYFEAAFNNLPESFAILDATGDTQSDADVIRQTISVLAEDGHGLITVPRGLNTAPRVAAEAGLSAGIVFRDLDGEGQDAQTIQRFMDQAAFRAGQTPGVMLLGRVQSDTLSALSRWGAQSSRASQVAVVPASAVMTAN